MTAKTKQPLEIEIVIARYIFAAFFAFTISILSVPLLAYIFGKLFSGSNSLYPFFIWFFSIGLAGVGSGSLCLPRSHQWFGSLFLLFLGLSFTARIFYNFNIFNDWQGTLFLFAPLGAGGFLPVIIHFLLRPKTNSNEMEVSNTISADNPNKIIL